MSRFIGCSAVGSDPTQPDPAAPHGRAAASVVIEQQDGASFTGWLVLPDNATPPFRPRQFPLRGSQTRLRVCEGMPDNGSDLSLTSDVEGLLGAMADPVPSAGSARGSGRIDPRGCLALAWSNDYLVEGQRWHIVTGMNGSRAAADTTRGRGRAR